MLVTAEQIAFADLFIAYPAFSRKEMVGLKAVCTLKKNSDFRRMYSKGKSCVTPYMVVYCRRAPVPRGRVGYTVSTKLGGAVTRNRVRRRLREIYRLNLPALKAGYDFVIVARGRSVGARYHSLNAAFLTACESLGVLKEDKP